jgi:hypothetical protein
MMGIDASFKIKPKRTGCRNSPEFTDIADSSGKALARGEKFDIGAYNLAFARAPGIFTSYDACCQYSVHGNFILPSTDAEGVERAWSTASLALALQTPAGPMFVASFHGMRSH